MPYVNRAGPSGAVEQVPLSGKAERNHIKQLLRNRFAEGMLVGEATTPGTAVFDVSAGAATVDGRYVNIAAIADQATGALAPGGGYSRMDLVELMPNGEVVYTQGSAGTSVTDSTNTVTSDALSGIVTLANEIKADLNAHAIDTTYHLQADLNIVTTADATTGSLASRIALSNVLREAIAAHFDEGNIHLSTDPQGPPQEPIATDDDSCEVLLDELKLIYNLHIADGALHSSGYRPAGTQGAYILAAIALSETDNTLDNEDISTTVRGVGGTGGNVLLSGKNRS